MARPWKVRPLAVALMARRLTATWILGVVRAFSLGPCDKVAMSILLNGQKDYAKDYYHRQPQILTVNHFLMYLEGFL